MLKTRPLKLDDLRDFVEGYHPENRRIRKATERFRFYSHEELMARDKASLDIFWLKDETAWTTCRRFAPVGDLRRSQP